MPYASTRVSRNTRVGGGPVFWFFYAMFAMPLWLMWQMLRGAILLLAWIVREAGAHQDRKRAVAAETAVMQPAEPQDEIPEDFRPVAPHRAEPAGHPRAVLLTLAVGVVAAIVTLVLLGEIQL